MKKTNQKALNTNNSVEVAKNISRSRSCRTDKSKVADKPDRHTSRVKFKENIVKGKSVKNVQFVRNTTVPLKRIPCTVNFTPCIDDKKLEENNSELPDETVDDDDVSNDAITLKLDVPELCSSLRFANKLLDEAVTKSKCTLNLNRFEKASTNAAKIKAVRKVNFPFDEHIFKDLVDLRVSEKDLFPDLEKRYKPKQFVVRNKEKEPDLSDFYKPSFDDEFVIKPDRPKVEPEKSVQYNGFSISDRLKLWQSS